MTQRTDTPRTWDERTQLATFLDYARDTARAKCEGVSEEDARKAPLPGSPLMTVCGLISRPRWVEHHWIQVMFSRHNGHLDVVRELVDGRTSV
jgi:hypothetical protein